MTSASRTSRATRWMGLLFPSCRRTSRGQFDAGCAAGKKKHSPAYRWATTRNSRGRTSRSRPAPLFPSLIPPGKQEAPSQPTPPDGPPNRGDEPVGTARTEASSPPNRMCSGPDVAPGRPTCRRPPTAGDAQLPVIGGTADESTTLSVARRDPARYFIDPETGRIWRRAYWDELHGAAKDDGLRQEER